MLINTTYRSTAPEIMDNFSMEGSLLRKTLDKIAIINERLGGNKATFSGLQTLLVNKSNASPVTIIDLGCGNGNMLRAIADYGRKKNMAFKLVGVDANEDTINYARELSVAYPEISYVKMNVFDEAFSSMKADIVIATLFLHHFTDEEIDNLLQSLLNQISIGIVINDLHRSPLAYYLFRLISIFITNPMVRNDGAVSVLRGFKKNELKKINNKLHQSSGTISWKWAFRFQWIIKKK